MNINCQERMLLYTLCTRNIQRSPVLKDQHGLSKRFCSKGSITHQDKCLNFHWFNGEFDTKRAFYTHVTGISMPLPQVKKLTFLFNAISSNFANFLLLHKKSDQSVITFTYEKYLTKYKYITSAVPLKNASGWVVLSADKIIHSVSNLIFKCTGGEYISFMYLLDGTFDCLSDMSDENENMQICKFHRICQMFFFKVFVNNYPVKYITHQAFLCKRRELIISYDMVNDLISDCGQWAEDESLLNNMLKYGIKTTCSNPNQIPCKTGHSKCYEVNQICKYNIDSNGNLFPCRNGGHLESCSQFNCGIDFKCTMSYCILWSYVCNGQWDCPSGEDESEVCGKRIRCDNMFKCRLSNYTCIHLGNICDGTVDCPLEDDEFCCDLKTIRCPPLCICIGYSLACNYSTVRITSQISPHILMIALNSNILHLNTIDKFYPKLRVLTLNQCEIKTVCYISFPGVLSSLDLSINEINSFQTHCFQSFKNLHTIVVDFNQIKTIHSHSFKSLPKLFVVSISHNPLQTVQNKVFSNCPSLKLVSLTNTQIAIIDQFAFHNIYDVILFTNDFHICCAVSPLPCSENCPWYIYCYDLLPDYSMKVSIAIISLTLILLNSCCMLHLILDKQENKAFSSIMRAVNFTDILCCGYLFIIWFAHVTLHGSFQLKEQIWRGSIPCFTAFFIIANFSLLSPLFMAILAICRLMLVWYPIDTKFKGSKFAQILLFIIFAFSLSIVSSITIAIRIVFKVLPTPLCLPFIDPTKSISIIIVVTLFSIVTQFFCVVLIITVYVLLIFALYGNRNIASKQKSFVESYQNLFIQLSLVSVANVVCSLSTNSTYIAAITLPKYPMEPIYWATILAMPINSLVNPSIFCILAVKKYVDLYWKI